MFRLIQVFRQAMLGSCENVHDGTVVDGVLFDDADMGIFREGHVLRVDADGCLDMGDMDKALGCDASAIDSILEATAKADASGKVGEQAQCVICLGDYEPNEEVVFLPCAHSFHKGCVRQWLSVSTKCPLCDKSVLDESA
uniref:RING-type domain-containing protein n=1 Tax=Lessardia elongata TaxID=210733 RepID=A0A7S2QW03_9DINO|mmetsp:Transcript_1222/g.922  ORF Transcript_1222/g.922 Transcript_1222/m.922 type:complete len:140 (+) Transcript_1222:76-495(+)